MSQFLDQEAAESNCSDSEREQDYDVDSEEARIDQEYADFDQAQEEPEPVVPISRKRCKPSKQPAVAKRSKVSAAAIAVNSDDDDDDEEVDEDEDSVDLHNHAAVDNEEAAASDESLMENARRQTTNIKKLARSVRPKGFKKPRNVEEDDDSDNAQVTLAEQKVRKQKKITRKSREKDEPAHYNNDIRPLMLAAGNKAGKLLDTPSSLHLNDEFSVGSHRCKVICAETIGEVQETPQEESNSVGTSSKRKTLPPAKVRSTNTKGILRLNEEFLIGAQRWKCTYEGTPCPLQPDGKGYDVSGNIIENLFTAEKFQRGDGSPSINVFLCNDKLQPMIVSAKVLVGNKPPVNEELGRKIISMNNLQVFDDGRKRMWLPQTVYTNVLHKWGKAEDKPKPVAAKTNGTANGTAKSSFMQGFDDSAGEDWIFARLKNACKVEAHDVKSLKNMFGFIPERFQEWKQGEGDKAWQKACDEYGPESMVWLLQMMSYFTEKGRKIVTDRAQVLSNKQD